MPPIRGHLTKPTMVCVDTDSEETDLLARGKGHRIAGFELIERIDTGSNNQFGEVWVAKRLEPFQRVAIKFLRPDRVNEEMVERFSRAESKALARFNHPYIARFYELGRHGVTPYLVMQYVPGDRFTAYADAHRLSIEDRLRLMAKVCDAVQHVHLQGVVHRDLKPANILVSESRPDEDTIRARGADRAAEMGPADRGPIPVLIDFGLAKSSNPSAPLASAVVSGPGMIGTPAYASPEQISARRSEDTGREADIYALGAVLFEVVAGVSPMEHVLSDTTLSDPERLTRLAKDERPSMSMAFGRLLPAQQEQIAAARGLGVDGMKQLLRSRLAHLTDRALRQEPTSRFSDARTLGLDIGNYLSDRDYLEAAAEPRIERWRRTVRRNRIAVGAGAAVVLALSAGLGAATWQWHEAVKAKESEAQRADQLKRVADFQSEMLGQINTTAAGLDLVTDLTERFAAALRRSGMDEAESAARARGLRGDLLRVSATDAAAALIDRTILKPAIKAINDRFRDDPMTGASLRQSLADLYYDIGLYPSALALQESAFATRCKELGEEHPDTLRSLNSLGALLQAMGRLDEAESVCMATLEKCRRALGDDHPGTRSAITNLATVLQARGRHADAERYFRESLELSRRTIGDAHEDTIRAISNLGFILKAQSKLDEARPLYERALEDRRRILGDDHPDTLVSMNNMGALLLDLGRPADAEPLYREALEKRRRVLGEEHPDTLISMNNLGFLMQAQGSFADAESLYLEALEKRRRALGDDHRFTLVSINNMGFLRQAEGRLDDAERYYREALERRRRVLGSTHPDTLRTIGNMATLLKDQHRLDEAEPFYEEALDGYRREAGENHPETLRSMYNLGTLRQAQGRLDDAERQYVEAMEKRRSKLGEDHPETLISIIGLSGLRVSQGRWQDALDLIPPSIETAARKSFIGGNAPRLAALLVVLGRARSGLGHEPGRFQLAESNLREAHAVLMNAKGWGPSHRSTLDCARALVELHDAWERAEPDAGHAARAAEWRKVAEAGGVSSPHAP